MPLKIRVTRNYQFLIIDLWEKEMKLMEWSDTLDVGVTSMNHQHQKLLDLMNRLYEGKTNGAPFDSLIPILSELKSYTIEHFQEEEKFMESINYSGIASHKIIHQQLLSKFGEQENLILDTRTFPDSFFSFLKVWLSAHIQGIDMKYGLESQSKQAV